MESELSRLRVVRFGFLTLLAVREAVLLGGAAADYGQVNLKLMTMDPLLFNVGVVLISNICMANVFVRLLGKLGFRMRLSLSLWLFGLNASSPVFRWLFGRVLQRGS